MIADCQRKTEVVDHGNRVSIGVQYESERHKRSTASMTVICKDFEVQTGKVFVSFLLQGAGGILVCYDSSVTLSVMFSCYI